MDAFFMNKNDQGHKNLYNIRLKLYKYKGGCSYYICAQKSMAHENI